MWAGHAHADEDVLDATSDMRFEEGLSALRTGKYEQARASFLQVLAVTPRKATVLWNLALAERNSGHYVEALGHLRAYFANPNADLNKNRELKQDVYRELLQATGHLKVLADGGTEIVVDGDVKGKTPLADVVDVKPGTYRVTAGSRNADVTVMAGEIKEVNLASLTPVQPVVLPPPKEAKESYWTGKHIAGVTAGGLAVVAAGVGVGFLAVRSGHVADERSVASDSNACATTTSSACMQYHDARSSAKTAAIVSGVSFGVAAALGVTAGILLWPKHKERARVIPTGQGILVEGVF